MKKFLSIFVTLLVAFVAFAFLTKAAEADKSVFGTKSIDDRERIKQISLDYLRRGLAARSIATNDFDVKSVNFDDLNMAHTKVRQTVAGIPVWEGEAIVHSNRTVRSLRSPTRSTADSSVTSTFRVDDVSLK